MNFMVGSAQLCYEPLHRSDSAEYLEVELFSNLDDRWENRELNFVILLLVQVS